MKLNRMKYLTRVSNGFGIFNLQTLAPEVFKATPGNLKNLSTNFFIDINDNLCAEYKAHEWVYSNGQWAQGK